MSKPGCDAGSCPDGQIATIDTIAVHPDHQWQGIGTRLLAHACARARPVSAYL